MEEDPPTPTPIEYVFTKTNNRVTWVAIGSPGFLRISGIGGSGEGTLKAEGGKISGKIYVAVQAFKTGIESRDKHMHEKYLETAKFPQAILTLKDAPYKADEEFAWTATLSLKGQEKPIKGGLAKIEQKKFTASFKIALDDFPGIGVPKYLGITMANDIEVVVEGSL